MALVIHTSMTAFVVMVFKPVVGLSIECRMQGAWRIAMRRLQSLQYTGPLARTTSGATGCANPVGSHQQEWLVASVC